MKGGGMILKKMFCGHTCAKKKKFQARDHCRKKSSRTFIEPKKHAIQERKYEHTRTEKKLS